MDLMAAFEQAALAVSRWQLDAAESLLRGILDDHPQAAPRALTELAVALSLQGRGDEALQTISRAVALAPLDATIRQNQLILEKLREPEEPDQFVALHRDWGNTFTPAGGCLHLGVPPQTHQRLRIAYLGVDAHTALQRFIPLLAEHHDTQKFDVLFCHGLADADRLAEARRRWPQIRHLGNRDLSARQFARTLAQHEIDIAIDLSGHGHGGTLQALAYRPAPVQMTWLDYVATTGVPAIGYRIADAVTDPDDGCSTEQVLRLPFAQWCATAPKRSETSSGRNRPDTPVIGLINVTVKLSPRLLALATALLQQHDQARLMVLGLTGEASRRHLLAHVPESLHSRLDLHDRVDEAQYHALVAQVDLAIDPTVFSGATSTLDALDAGIPVLTIPGRLPHTRSTASILDTLGLSQWIARDDADLLAIAAALLRDPAAIQAARTTLRDRLRQSTLADGRRFTAALEELYSEVWSKQTPAEPSAARSTLLVRQVNDGIAAQTPQQVIYALEALTLFQTPPKLQRTLALAYNQLGVQWLKRGGRFEARRQFDMALEVLPELEEARHNLALC
ncbi:MAG: hypothetical protein IPK97_09910 [Ahniella sp.]|nr:hypothetical protein [Ahniella sp.]